MEKPSNKNQSQIKMEVYSDLRNIKYGVVSNFFKKLNKKKPHLLIESFQYLIGKTDNDDDDDDSEWIVLKAYDTNLKIFKTLKVQFMEFCKSSYGKYAKILQYLYPTIINEMNTDITLKIYDFYTLTASKNESLPLYFVIESEPIHNTLSRCKKTVDCVRDLQSQSIRYLTYKFNFSCQYLLDNSYDIIAGSDNSLYLKVNPLNSQMLEILQKYFIDQKSIQNMIKSSKIKYGFRKYDYGYSSYGVEESDSSSVQVQNNNGNEEEEEIDPFGQNYYEDEEKENDNVNKEEEDNDEVEKEAEEGNHINDEGNHINDKDEDEDEVEMKGEGEEEDKDNQIEVIDHRNEEVVFEEVNADEEMNEIDNNIQEEIINDDSEYLNLTFDEFADLSDDKIQKLKLKKKHVVINKENFVTTLNELYPKLNERHDSQIFEIISEHPKYHELILYDYDENTFILKLMYEEKKHYLKCEKYESILQAEQIYKNCMLLKRSKLFKPFVDLEIVPLEASSYILYLEEDLDDQLQFISNMDLKFKRTKLGLDIVTLFLEEFEKNEFEQLQFSNILQLRLEIIEDSDCEYRFYFPNPYFRHERQLQSTNNNQFVDDNVVLFVNLAQSLSPDSKSFLYKQLEQYLVIKSQIKDTQISSFPFLYRVYSQQKIISEIKKIYSNIDIYLNGKLNIDLYSSNEMLELKNKEFQSIFDKDSFRLVTTFAELNSILGKLTEPSNIKKIYIHESSEPAINNIHKLREYFPHLQSLQLRLDQKNKLTVEKIGFNQLSQLQIVDICISKDFLDTDFKDIEKNQGYLSSLFAVFDNKHLKNIKVDNSSNLFSFLSSIDSSFLKSYKEKPISKSLVNEYKMVQYFYGYLNQEQYQKKYEEIVKFTMIEACCPTNKKLLQLEDRERTKTQIEEEQISQSSKDDSDFEYNSEGSFSEEQNELDKKEEGGEEEEEEDEDKGLTKSEEDLEDQYEYQSQFLSSSEDIDEEERNFNEKTQSYLSLISQIQLIVNTFDYLSCKLICSAKNGLKTLHIRFQRKNGNNRYIQLDLQIVNGDEIVKINQYNNQNNQHNNQNNQHNNQSVFSICNYRQRFNYNFYFLYSMVEVWLENELKLQYMQEIFGYQESCGCLHLDQLTILKRFYCDQVDLEILTIEIKYCKLLKKQLKNNPDFFGLSQLRSLNVLNIVLEGQPKKELILFRKNSIKNNKKLHTINLSCLDVGDFFENTKQQISPVFWKLPRLVNLSCSQHSDLSYFIV